MRRLEMQRILLSSRDDLLRPRAARCQGHLSCQRGQHAGRGETMAAQAGLGYNWQKSFDQTNPHCRRWVNDARIEGIPFAAAMERILGPVGLRYEVENGQVVLYRNPHAPRLPVE